MKEKVMIASMCIMLLSGIYVTRSLIIQSDYIDLVDRGQDFSGFNPIVVSPGDNFHVWCDVCNGGTDDSDGFYVGFYLSTNQVISTSDYPLGEDYISNVPGGYYADADWQGSLPSSSSLPSGTYYVGWIIDVDGDVTESNETNNVAYKPYFLNVMSAGPDVGVEIIGQTGTIVHDLPEEETCGHQYGVWIQSCTDITVIGNNVLDNSDIGIYIVDSQDVTITGNNISGGRVGIQIEYSEDCYIGKEEEGNTVSNNMFENIYIVDSNNITISNNDVLIADRVASILMFRSSNVDLFTNRIMSGNCNGISLSSSSFVNVVNNNVTENEVGIVVEDSSNNTLKNNMITLNNVGMNITESSDNILYHNNFIDNSVQAEDDSNNSWNEAYPLGGNYWNDYDGEDVFSGVYQNVSICSDGIGDTPYNIAGGDSHDRYPIISSWEDGKIFSHNDHLAGVFSNSSVTSLGFDEEAGEISFNVEDGTFCNVIVPKELLDGAFTVMVDEEPIASILGWDETHVFISLTYSQGIHNVKLKGEYKKILYVTNYPDLNGDGVVNILDLAQVAIWFGKSPP